MCFQAQFKVLVLTFKVLLYGPDYFEKLLLPDYFHLFQVLSANELYLVGPQRGAFSAVVPALWNIIPPTPEVKPTLLWHLSRSLLKLDYIIGLGVLWKWGLERWLHCALHLCSSYPFKSPFKTRTISSLLPIHFVRFLIMVCLFLLPNECFPKQIHVHKYIHITLENNLSEHHLPGRKIRERN